MPRISVIIPAYNCEKFILPCMHSLLAQTEQDWEAIIVDDGSTDRTLEIATRIAAEDSRLRLISQPHSGKPGIARNTGLRQAKGEFLCFLDGDDCYDERKLARQLAVMDTYPSVACIFHDVRLIDAEGCKLAATYLGEVAFLEKARANLVAENDHLYLSGPGFYGFISVEINGMHTSAVMIRRSAFDEGELYFPEDIEIGEDIDLWFRIAKGRQVAFIDEALSSYRQHEASITRNHERVLLGQIAAHTRNLERASLHLSKEQVGRYRSRIGRLHRHLGYAYFSVGKLAESRLAYRQSASLDFHWATLYNLTKTYFPQWLVTAYRRNTSL